MRLRKGVFYVFIATFINLVVNIISGFLLPKFLSIDTYAHIATYQLYIIYIGILHLGFSDGIYLKYGGVSIKSIDARSLYGEFKTFKGFQLLVCLVAIVVCFVTRDPLLLICALSILPINVSNYLRNLYQATGEFKKYARFTNINTFLILVMNLGLLFAIKSDYYLHYIIAYLLAYILYWLFLEWEMGRIVKRVKVKLNIGYLVENVREGFSLMIGNFSVVATSSIDRLLVKKLMGLTEFAFFSFAVSVQSLVNLFITPIATVMYNFFCKHIEPGRVMLIKNTTLLIAAVLISVAFVVKFIVERFVDKYIPSLDVLFVLFAAQFFLISVRVIFTNLYKATRQQKKYLQTVIIVMIMTVVFSLSLYVLYPSMISIAIGTLAASLLWFILCERDFKQYRYETGKLIYIFVVILAFLFAGMTQNSLLGVILYAIIILIASLVLMKKECKYLLGEIGDAYSKLMRRSL